MKQLLIVLFILTFSLALCDAEVLNYAIIDGKIISSEQNIATYQIKYNISKDLQELSGFDLNVAIQALIIEKTSQVSYEKRCLITNFFPITIVPGRVFSLSLEGQEIVEEQRVVNLSKWLVFKIFLSLLFILALILTGNIVWNRGVSRAIALLFYIVSIRYTVYFLETFALRETFIDCLSFALIINILQICIVHLVPLLRGSLGNTFVDNLFTAVFTIFLIGILPLNYLGIELLPKIALTELFLIYFVIIFLSQGGFQKFWLTRQTKNT